MGSVRGRLILLSVLVTWVTVALVGVAVERFTAARFEAFVRHMPQAGTPGPSMMRKMTGGPERRFLEDVRRAIWLAAVIGLGVAAVAGTVTARRITAPLHALATGARRVGRGDLSRDVPVTGSDEIAEMARTFNAMAADLRRAEEARRQLLADVAHELGTPLAVLQANLEGMLDGVVEASPARLASLHTQTQVLTRLVRDLRDLALLREGALPLDRRPIDLGALVREVTESAHPAARERGVSLTAAGASVIPGGSPVVVHADRDRIAQVLHNLVSNALRHTEQGGEIRLAVSGEGEEGWVEVADSGTGIPAGDVAHVFERFHRVDRSRARATGGAGLGLAIVKQLIEAHGGRVWVHSLEGRGSTFGFALPLAVAAVTAAS